MKSIEYFFLLLFFLGLVYACNNPLENVSIKIKDPLTASAINFTYRNAVSNDTTMLPKNMKFTFIGDDIDGIVSSVGNKKIKISNEGLFGIAISPDYTKRPVNIGVVASLEGYLTDINYVTLTNTANINKTIKMFNINNLPTGMSVDIQNIESTNLQTINKTLKTNGKNEQVALNISSGTTIINKNNKVLSGNLSSVLTYFENSAREFVPNNYTVYQAIGLDNKVLPPFDFITYGFFSFKTIDGKFDEGSILSKASNVNIEISDNSYHTNEVKIKEGDTIPFWGFINNVWKMLDKPVLKRNSRGKLSISASVLSLGYYAIGEMIPVCEKGPVITISSPYNGLDIYHYSRLLEKNTGRNVGDLYLSLSNGAKYYLAGRRKNTVILQVFNYNNQFGGDLSKPIFQSEAFDLCDEKNIQVEIVAPPPQPVNVELIIECAKGQVVKEEAIPAKIDIQFQPKGAAANDWRDLMTLTRTQRSGSTYKLKVGSTYSIRASPNPAQGWLFYKRDTLINNVNYRFYIENKDYCK